MDRLPAHSRELIHTLQDDADDADVKADLRDAWADGSERQAAAWRAEARYLRAYAAAERGLAESAGPDRGKHARTGASP